MDHLPLGERIWEPRILLERLEAVLPLIGDRLYKRIADAVPSDADTLCDYAIFLVEQRGDLDGAEAISNRRLRPTRSTQKLSLTTRLSFAGTGDTDSAGGVLQAGDSGRSETRQ